MKEFPGADLGARCSHLYLRCSKAPLCAPALLRSLIAVALKGARKSCVQVLGQGRGSGTAAFPHAAQNAP